MSENTTKICRYCKKAVQNLSSHIIKMHPAIMDQLEETGELPQAAATYPQNTPHSATNNPVTQSLREMIREKAETLMDLKIMDTMTRNPEVSIQDLAKMTEPTAEKTSLAEVKELHDMIYSNAARAENSDWPEVVIEALPLMKEILVDKRKERMKHGKADKKSNGSSDGSVKPSVRRITDEDSGNSGESGSNSRESGRTGRMSEPTSKSIGQSSSRDKGGGPISRGRNGRK